jgi:AcrR family transcriptional regulator
MPKETFFNLPEAKRRAICQEAIAEFAAHPFNQASINRIVARSDIAKGSFYQYFADKKDLFLYLMQLAGEKKLEYLAPVLQNSEQQDFFSLLRALYVAGIRFAKEHPDFAEISKRFMESKGTPLYEEIIAGNMPTASKFFETLLQRALARGEVRSDIDVEMFAYLIASLNTLVLEYYSEHVAQDYDESMMATVDQFIDFLRRGIGAGPDAASTHPQGVSP